MESGGRIDRIDEVARCQVAKVVRQKAGSPARQERMKGVTWSKPFDEAGSTPNWKQRVSSLPNRFPQIREQ